MYEGLQFSLVP